MTVGSNIESYIEHPQCCSDVAGTPTQPTQHPEALSFSRGHAWATQLSSIQRPKVTWNLLNAMSHLRPSLKVTRCCKVTWNDYIVTISENQGKSTFIHRCLSAVPFGSETWECLRVQSDSFLIRIHECPVTYNNMELGRFTFLRLNMAQIWVPLEKMIIHWLSTFRSPACVAPLLLVRTCQTGRQAWAFATGAREPDKTHGFCRFFVGKKPVRAKDKSDCFQEKLRKVEK